MRTLYSNLLFTTEYTAAMIVSVPHERYVLERNRGTVRCQNRSEDQQIFYSYITNAVWYRAYENGTSVQIGSSGPVYSSRHRLNFVPPVRESDEGVYYCCAPLNGPCGNSSGRNTVVRISSEKTHNDCLWLSVYAYVFTLLAPPIVSAANLSHISTVGSNITLKCNIVNEGVPQATFSWSRNGYELNGIKISNSTMAVTLTNLTLNDAGVYTCAANGLLSYHSDDMELSVVEEIVKSTYVR